MLEFGPQFRQGDVGLFVHHGLQASLQGGGQQGFPATLMSQWIQRAAPLEVLAHAAHRCRAITQHGGNLPGPVAL